MPYAALPTCRAPRCSALGRGGWCDAHRPAPRVLKRPTTAARGYGAAWQRIRQTVLARTPLCPCGAAATQVDHIQPLSHGGTHAPANLRAMCASCHSRRTATDPRTRWRRRASP